MTVAATTKAHFMLSAFGDEIDPDFETQLEVLAEHNIRYVELRGAWGQNVVDFDEASLARIERLLTTYGVKVSAIGSPVGKISIEANFEPELDRLERVIEIARRLGTPYIRMFSFFMPAGSDPANYRLEVLRRLGVFLQLAEKHDMILLHENEKGIYGDTAERCADLLETLNSARLRLTFDPANFVQCGVRPFGEAYPRLRQYIEYVHIKDAFFEDGRVVVAGAGEGEVDGLLAALARSGYTGFLSLEPHLSAAGVFSGYSGARLFGEAVTALRELLGRLEESSLPVS